MSTTTHQGACHCGVVRYAVTLPELDKAFACNCSICSKTGWLLAFTPAANFALLQGAENLSDYQFDKKAIHHLFCTTCGIRSFGRGLGHDGQEWISVNLRCLEGVDAAALPVERFDGAAL